MKQKLVNLDLLIRKDRREHKATFRDTEFTFAELTNALTIWEIMELMSRTEPVEVSGVKMPPTLLASIKIIQSTLVEPQLSLDDLIQIVLQDAPLFFFLLNESSKVSNFEEIGGDMDATSPLKAFS